MAKRNSMTAFSCVGGFGGEKGMTLRDYFAAKALSGLVSNPNWDESLEVVEDAYRLADLMMEERDK